MKIEVLADSIAVARMAASIIAQEARAAVATRGRFIVAFSGGKTPALMFDALTKEEMPWEKTHLFQVDERVAPAGHIDRNLTQLREKLLDRVSLSPKQIHPMPVESQDLDASTWKYALTLQEIAGSSPVLDLIHLGLGSDGHTASLIPHDPVLDIQNEDVAMTNTYQGRRRMTLTYPMIDRSRRILWVIAGNDKKDALARLNGADSSIPAGRVCQNRGVVVADMEAAAHLEQI